MQFICLFPKLINIYQFLQSQIREVMKLIETPSQNYISAVFYFKQITCKRIGYISSGV